jgi:hypothetical protein
LTSFSWPDNTSISCIGCSESPALNLKALHTCKYLSVGKLFNLTWQAKVTEDAPVGKKCEQNKKLYS